MQSDYIEDETIINNFIARYILPMSYWVCYDHGGVLEGEIRQKLIGEYFPNNYSELAPVGGLYDWYKVIIDGPEFIERLNYLVIHHRLGITFHSKNKLKDQIILYRQLREHGFPRVRIIPVYNKALYKGYHSSTPKKELHTFIIGDQEEQILVLGYGADLANKKCIRNALRSVLIVNPQNMWIFDDGPTCLATQGEDHCGCLVTIDENVNHWSKIVHDTILQNNINLIED